MYRHLKIFLILILFIVSDKIFSNQLSQVEFYSNSKFLSPNNDGYNDEIIFYVILHQNLPIKVKEWSIYILNYESRIITIIAPQKRISNEKEYRLVWNGKDPNGNYVPDGNYKAILRVYYDYGNISKEFIISFDVYRDNFNVELNFINPYLFKKWDPQKKDFTNIINEVQILQNYQKDFTIKSEFNSYILDLKYDLVEARNWEKKPQAIILWDGRIKDNYADFSIYHYMLAYKNYEKKLYQYILPGIFVLPIKPEINLFLSPFIINSDGKGFLNNVLQSFELIKPEEKTISKFKPNVSYLSKYYQIYCFKQGLLSNRWRYLKDGISDISKDGLEQFISILPKNQYCQIIFFKNTINNFEYEKLMDFPVLTILPIYIDEQKPEIKIALKHSFIRPDYYYDNFFQEIEITANDNTFIKEINLYLFLNYFNKRLLIKTWKIIPDQIGINKNQVEKTIYWYGDILQNFSVESLENLTLQVEAIDIANHKSYLEYPFKTDVFFREVDQNYVSMIPLSIILDEENKIHATKENFLKKIVQEYYKHKKKYIYIKVHSHTDGKDDENLYRTESISKQLFDILVKDIPEKNIFFRGVGELYPQFKDKSEFSKYRNDRVEIIFSDELFSEEKNLY